MWSQKTSSNNPRLHQGAWGCIGGHRQTNNSLWLKKQTIQKVICDLWDQYCAASVTSKYHMCVSNGRRYRVQSVCHEIKAGGLYICSITATVTLIWLSGLLAYLQNIQHVILYTLLFGHLKGLVTAWKLWYFIARIECYINKYDYICSGHLTPPKYAQIVLDVIVEHVLLLQMYFIITSSNLHLKDG